MTKFILRTAGSTQFALMIPAVLIWGLVNREQTYLNLLIMAKDKTVCLKGHDLNCAAGSIFYVSKKGNSYWFGHRNEIGDTHETRIGILLYQAAIREAKQWAKKHKTELTST